MENNLEKVLRDIQYIIKKHNYTRQDTDQHILNQITEIVNNALRDIDEKNKIHPLQVYVVDKNGKDVECEFCWEIIDNKLFKDGVEVASFKNGGLDYNQIGYIIMDNEPDVVTSVELDNKEVFTNDKL